MTASILVTDGEQRAALATVRSLGRGGHRLTVCAARVPSLAGASRFAAAEFAVPDPIADPDGHGAAVSRLAREREIEVILPMTEASLLAILPVRDDLPDVVIPFPPLETFQAVSDKTNVIETARELGIAVPEGWRLERPADLRAVSIPTDAFPLVAKPGRSVAGPTGARKRLGVAHVASEDDLIALADALPPSAFPLYLQERIHGPGVGIFVLLWEGELLATFAHRRLREKPPSGGVSVLRESIAADPGLVEASRRLLDRYGWSGVAMVEFKLDRESGRAYLMEINGRFWGSLQLAIDSGVDFPRLLVEAATGPRPAPLRGYRTGVRLRWLWGDVDHLIARLRRSRAELDLPSSAPGRLRTVLAFLGAFFTSRAEVARLSDPSPAFRECAEWFRSARRGGRPSGDRVPAAGESA